MAHGSSSTEESLDLVEKDKLKVRKWREGGSDESKAPPTCLDRVNSVQKAGISRREMLDVLELYNSRNEEAHKPPPAMERFVVKKDEVWVIDW